MGYIESTHYLENSVLAIIVRGQNFACYFRERWRSWGGRGGGRWVKRFGTNINQRQTIFSSIYRAKLTLTVLMCCDLQRRTWRTLSFGIIRSHPDSILNIFPKVSDVDVVQVRRYEQQLGSRFSRTYSSLQRSSPPAASLSQREVLRINLQSERNMEIEKICITETIDKRTLQ